MANKEKIEAAVGANLLYTIRNMKTAFDKVFSLKEANLKLTQELEAKSEALKMSADLLKAADEKVKKLESVVAEQRVLVKSDHSSEESRVLTTCIVSTASQTVLNIPDYNANIVRPPEAADKIRGLEDQLDEKTKYIIKLKNKLTSYRLRKEPHLWPNYNYLADLEEYSNAEVQGAIEVGMNDTPITNDQIRTEACFNSQEYPQRQVEQKSVHSKRTPKANSTETTCGSSQLQSCVKKQTSESTPHLPVPEDEKPKLVIPEDELCAEESSIGELWKPARKSQKIHSEQLDLGSAPPTEADRALPSNDVSPCTTAAVAQSAPLEKKKRRRRRKTHSVNCVD
jgi:hypothetical protein